MKPALLFSAVLAVVFPAPCSRADSFNTPNPHRRPASRDRWEEQTRRKISTDLQNTGAPLMETASKVMSCVSLLQCERERWGLDIVRQLAVDNVLNERKDLGPVLLTMARHPQAPAVGVLGIAHYRHLTWAECRGQHARTLEEMRRARSAIPTGRPPSSPGGGAAAAKPPEDDDGSLMWLVYGPSLLARFPTPASIEELALILESVPMKAEFSADALSVCVTPAAVPQVSAALRTALEQRAKMEKETGRKPENDFARLKAKLANPSANLLDLPDVMGVRFVIPDPEAAAVNDLPAPAPSSAPTAVAAVAAPGAGSQGWSWWWLLLLLIPVTAWAAPGRNKR